MSTSHPLLRRAALTSGGLLLLLAENHHLLALLRVAEAGLSIPLDEILLRSQLSQLKWMLGHVSFALVGLTLPTTSAGLRAIRASLVWAQLSLGALTWAVADGPWLPGLIWVRYTALIAGFFGVAWMASAPRWPPANVAAAAAGSGAPG